MKSQLVSAKKLNEAEPILLWIIAALLWVFSLMGNVYAVDTVSDDWLLTITIAIGFQIICTLMQYVSCYKWWSPLYIISLGASSIASMLGYFDVIAQPLARFVEHITGPSDIIRWVVYGVVYLTFVIADIVPERIVVSHD
jgi:D-alanyl-lipoteichoic acid acyltransferase DltB (MBOAT superfamily)